MTNHPHPHILRYDEHMPEVDDLSLIVLKGHLLVEEMLHQAVNSLAPHAEHLEEARLSFAQLCCVVRSLAEEVHEHFGWELVLALNRLRNDLVHSLEPPKLETRIATVIELYFRAKIRPEINYEPERKLELFEQLRNVICDCQVFVRGISFRRRHRNGGIETGTLPRFDISNQLLALKRGKRREDERTAPLHGEDGGVSEGRRRKLL